jgi:GNAT superfamily N-acetyltransferase
MTDSLDMTIRPIAPSDYAAWRPLWDGYNQFYGRHGVTALPEHITAATWARFLDPREAVHAFVAEQDGELIGLVHCLFHRSTTRLIDVCYLQDLFTAEPMRGKGVARRLIQAVTDLAREAGSTRVYWTTHLTNEAGRRLYDKVASHLGFIVYSQEI